jgi:hypothetical protein
MSTHDRKVYTIQALEVYVSDEQVNQSASIGDTG